jgi:hypothetical protein
VFWAFLRLFRPSEISAAAAWCESGLFGVIGASVTAALFAKEKSNAAVVLCPKP